VDANDANNNDDDATHVYNLNQDSNDDCPLSLFDYDVLSSLITSNDGEGCF